MATPTAQPEDAKNLLLGNYTVAESREFVVIFLWIRGHRLKPGALWPCLSPAEIPLN